MEYHKDFDIHGENMFRIENIYGESRPKLLCVYKDPATWSNLISSNLKKDGLTIKEKCLWQIVDVSRNIEPIKKHPDESKVPHVSVSAIGLTESTA